MPTASLTAVIDELARRMDRHGSGGVVVCRAKRVDGELRPDLGWSQHAYGNADDWMIFGYSAQLPYVQTLDQMRTEGFPVGTVLWAGNRPSDHTDHIHIEGSPAISGTPECAGGEALADETENQSFWQQFWGAWGNFLSNNPTVSGDLNQDGIGDIGPQIPNPIGLAQDLWSNLPRLVWGLVAVLAFLFTAAALLAAFAKSDAGQATAGMIASRGTGGLSKVADKAIK